MGNRWKEIWNNRTLPDILVHPGEDEFGIYAALKEMDGFDVSVENREGYYRNFYDTAVEMCETLRKNECIKSVFEVGCGSGANLYLLKNRNMKIGGIDYSQTLVEAANKILGNDAVHMGEAIDIHTDEKYDVVLCDSVFAYFPSEEYGAEVLRKMYQKAEKMVIISEVFDKDSEEECNRYRRSMMEDYDEKYKGLEKIFYSRNMFRDFAREHKCRIAFTEVTNEYYWNSKYLFNCVLYKEA